MGYIKSIVGALIVGFAIGLWPTVRKMFSQHCYQWIDDCYKN
jgi:hypothetical protein